MRWMIILVAAGGWAASAAAQQKPEPKPGDIAMAKYLAAETDKLSAKFLDGAKSLDEWKAKLPRLRREYLDMLGLDPLPEKTPLKATITRTFENQGVVIDNLHFQSRPGLYVTGNLYRPKNNAKKLPTILYLCGHANMGRDGNKSNYQEHGLWFASNGYNCLILDSLQLGEIPGTHHGTYKYDRWWWHSAGYTPAGVECWNGIRAIDYLLTRSDVDGDKIGVTGISGGGAATVWISAADERVKVSVPVSGFSDLECYVKDKVIDGHCDCMFLYNTYQWEFTTILALIAPRPMLFANSDNDPIFPMPANRRIAEKLRKLYGMYGKESLFDEYVSVGGHAYRPDLRVAIFKFFNKHLKGDAAAPVEDSAKFAKIPGKELRVFPTDEDYPRDRINGEIDETFVAQGKLTLPKGQDFAKWRDEMIARIRQRSFRPLPTAISTVKDGPMFAIQTEPGIECSLVTNGNTDKGSRIHFVVQSRRRDKEAEDRRPFLNDLFKEEPYAILAPRGIDLPWTKKSPPNTVERSHMLLGRTVDQGAVRDVLAGFDKFSKLAKANKKSIGFVCGLEDGGIMAAYAGLFDPSMSEFLLLAPPSNQKDGPQFPGILRELDIPEALGLLAPRKLTIVCNPGEDTAFARTAEIYRLAGAADKFNLVIFR
jgi:dienelactone hydrolase